MARADCWSMWLSRAITYSFTDATSQSILFADTALALKNPISAELGVMRVSLWPGLIHAVRENQRRQQQRVRLFEIGRRFTGSGAEDEVISGVASGPVLSPQWEGQPREVDFFDVKADVEALLSLAGNPEEIRFVAEPHPALHPGQSARIYRGTQAIGWLGSLHPQHRRALDLTYRVVAFEVETHPGLVSSIPEYHNLRYPGIRRDIAVIVDESVTADARRGLGNPSVPAFCKGSCGTTLSTAEISFDKGKKSIALGLHLPDTSRTLTGL